MECIVRIARHAVAVSTPMHGVGTVFAACALHQTQARVDGGVYVHKSAPVEKRATFVLFKFVPTVDVIMFKSGRVWLSGETTERDWAARSTRHYRLSTRTQQLSFPPSFGDADESGSYGPGTSTLHPTVACQVTQTVVI